MSAASKARDRGVSFEEKILSKKNSRQKNDTSSRQQGGRQSNDVGNSIRLDLTKKLLEKNFQLPKTYNGKEVQSLCLRANRVEDMGSEGGFPKIRTTDNVFNFKFSLRSIVTLDLSQNKIKTFLSATVLATMPNLRHLQVNNNQIESLQSDSLKILGELGQIEELNLGTNALEQLPAEIGELRSLRKLVLSNNKLVTLPREIIELEHLYAPDAFSIGGNGLIQPQQVIAQQGGMELIRTYFLLSSQPQSVPTVEHYKYNLVMREVEMKPSATPGGGRRSQQLKLLVVGRDGAGKTQLIQRLQKATTQYHKGDAAPSAPSPIRAFSDDNVQVTPARPKGTPRAGFKLEQPGAGAGAGAGTGAGITSPFSPGSRPTTPSTNHSASYTPSKQAECDLGCIITNWFPKKADLDRFIHRGAAENKKLKDLSKALFAKREEIKFTVWNFVGKWMFHNVHEMFFTVSALHMVVFDISQTATEHDVDKHVQYWIDLIQARAPGSTIIIVATHADYVSAEEEQRRLEMVKKRIASNEVVRKADLEKDIQYCRDPDRQAAFRRLLSQRPVVDPEIITLRIRDPKLDYIPEEELTELLCLSVGIMQLVTPTRQNPHPFATIDTQVQDFYWVVKDAITQLRKENRPYCTLSELNRAILNRHAESGKSPSNTILSGIRLALTHWSSVGEILWFGSDKQPRRSGEKTGTGTKESSNAAQSAVDDSAPQFRRLTRAFTGDLLGVSDVVFLDPNWLMGVIKAILDTGLIADIQTSDHFHLTVDEESRKADRALAVHKDLAKRGIIRWDFIRSYLDRRDYEDCKILDVVRTILEDFNVIIPIRTEQRLSESFSTASDSASAAMPAAVSRGRTEPAIFPTMPPTPLAGRAPAMRGFTSPSGATSNLTGAIAASTNPRFDRLVESRSSDSRYYLIPSLLPRYEPTSSVVPSGTITLQRTFHFNRFTPPGLIPTIFSRIYAFQEDQLLTGVDGSSPNLCWDSAFTQQQNHVKILVQLVAGGENEEGAAMEEGGSQDLRIRGTGHVLNAHVILERLDDYTAIVQGVLSEYPGLGHVRLGVTCPQCLLNIPDEKLHGEFRHSDLLPLQQSFQELKELLNKSTKAGLDQHTRKLMRKLDDKRHTCPKVRTHEIKSEHLIPVQRKVKEEIERASHAEKELNFLLDEVVRTAAIPLGNVVKSVVKIMAANCLSGQVQKIKDFLASMEDRDLHEATLQLAAIQHCSGVVVPLPEGHPMMTISPTADRTNEVLVLACEHVITQDTMEDGKIKFSRKGAQEGEAVFVIGDATQWLYLAEMVFQGSTYPGSESNFWDMCALRIIAPIVPIQQSMLRVDEVKVILRGQPSLFSLEASCSIMSIDTSDGSDTVELRHPHVRGSPMHSIPVAPYTVAVDQVVRRLGYPNYPRQMGISVDWGRVQQNDHKGDILISLLSDNGASGGPVVDREGLLIGLLSRSHDLIKLSCVQQLRNLFDILRDCQHLM